jgi:membrane protein YdbS with pleckstrin-like domain
MTQDAYDPEIAQDEAARSAGRRALEEEERVYFEGSPILRGDIGRLVLLALVGLALIVTPIVTSALGAWTPPWWGWLALIVLGIVFLILPYALVKTIRYRISNYRIDYEHGLLSKSIDTLELWHVDDIHFRQSPIDRIFRVGTITVISNDSTTPRLPLHGLPRPRELFDQLKQRVIAVKRMRGVIKMDMGGGNIDAG